ncbi:MAG: 16S rRNA (guanine(527)-N(7))-methyltransferase RsmG [Spirochaetes bacterium RBG_13_51_14]|nr:MAG: 16S rRNA (guanine(527)-N(7))-methyltransferase RsmG [Spirochaetes bacterium RBG_13_51_14]
MTDKKHDMQKMFRRCGFDLSPRQLEQFDILHGLLEKHTESLDLTRLTSFPDIVIKHFIDSIYITKYVALPSPLLDIGTGAGFPGIPLKILDPGLTLVLSEPRKKRARFLELAVRELGLSDVEVYPHMVTGRSFFSVKGVITRALESIDKTLSRVNHFLPRGGIIIFMKGPGAGDDSRELSPENRLAYSLETTERYTLPDTDFRRHIIVYAKETSSTRKTYSILKDLSATAGTAITSKENRTYKDLKKLTEVDGVRKSGTALVSGKKIIAEIMNRGRVPGRVLILHDGYSEDDDEMNRRIGEFEDSGSLLILKKSLYNEIDLFNTRSPLLVAEIPELKEWDMDVGPGCTLLIPFQDPVNVGSAIRSAAGFSVKKIIILKEAANPYHPKSVRASAGSVFGAGIMTGPSLYELPDMLGSAMKAVVALDTSGEPLAGFRFPERFLLLPGIEGPGLPPALKNRSVSIPLNAAVESLNAPVALSIALYEWSRQSPSN